MELMRVNREDLVRIIDARQPQPIRLRVMGGSKNRQLRRLNLELREHIERKTKCISGCRIVIDENHSAAALSKRAQFAAFARGDAALRTNAEPRCRRPSLFL